MTRLEILELALLGTAYNLSVANKEYVKAIINAIPGSSTGAAQKQYYSTVCRRIEQQREEILRLIAAEKERAEG